ncbi:MAG: Uma2 family endonuclease [Bacteroidia bacterium]|nr:Uma2 family endonuclease [Bacteroidia bacterium]
MHTILPSPPAADLIVYPQSDGKPRAENTWQARWMVLLYGNLRSFLDLREAFVAMDLLWYPVEGQSKISAAPDVMVVFGRPDGDRPSWMQWKEEGLGPQVVFEVLSPSNSAIEMLNKQHWYGMYGVEECIVIDPGTNPGDPERFSALQRHDGVLKPVPVSEAGWTSPRLGVRFCEEAGRLRIYAPDGSPFRSFESLKQQLEDEKRRAEEALAEVERLRARLRELEP